MNEEFKCWVSFSMNPELQQGYWKSIGEEFEIRSEVRGKYLYQWLVFKEHKLSEFGNCQRCGWRPKK